MHFNDHNPPHFHVKYGHYKAMIDIDNFEITEGSLPKKILSSVVKWAKMHQKELLDNWNEIIITGKFNKIKPLKKLC